MYVVGTSVGVYLHTHTIYKDTDADTDVCRYRRGDTDYKKEKINGNVIIHCPFVKCMRTYS